MKKTSLLFQVLFVGIVLTMIAVTAHALSWGNFVNPDASPVTAATPLHVQKPANQLNPTGQPLIRLPVDEDVRLRADEVIPSIGINLSGKMDVALAIGKATFAVANPNKGKTISYASFQNELRSCFNGPSPQTDLKDGEAYVTTKEFYYDKMQGELWSWLQEPAQVAKYGQNAPMLTNGDLYIDASTMSTISTTGSFKWWKYDHISGTTSLNHQTRIYYENVHSYQNQYSGHSQSLLANHIELSPDGADMTFYGYGTSGYKDFVYLPHTEPTRKVFEFSIQEEDAGHTLDGVGFFFNCMIDTIKPYGSGQTMTGYLLHLGYVGDPGKGESITIYKFKNVDTKDFHNKTTKNLTDQGYGDFSCTTGDKWTAVARTYIYQSNANKMSRHMKIEVDPEYVRMWYIGGTKNDEWIDLDGNKKKIVDIKIDSLPDADRDKALIQVGTSIFPTTSTTDWVLKSATDKMSDVPGGIALDQNYIFEDGYGFGPVACYRSHGCSQTTTQKFTQLTMSSGSVRKLHEVVADPHWHDNTKRVLVNLNLQDIVDFSTSAQMGDLLARVINDNIYYIGWCSDDNETQSEQFANASNPQGSLINVEADDYNDGSNPASDNSRKKQILEMAKVIYDVWYKANVDNRVLVTDNVNFVVAPAELGANTADPDWPDGKWKFIHKTPNELQWKVDPNAADNSTTHSLNDRRLSNLDIDFTHPGEYDIYYRDVMIKTITAHRTPVAQFTVNMADLNAPVFTDTSYDPDDYDPESNPDGSFNSPGIVQTDWKWVNLTDNTWGSGTPSSLTQDHVYLIELTVKDKWGVTATAAKTLKPSSSGVKEPPMAVFRLGPVTFIKNLDDQKITIDDHSYDDYGRNFTYSWHSPTSGLISQLGINANGAGTGTYSVPSTLSAGEYKIELTVTDDEDYQTSLLASRKFWVIEDEEAPKARVDKKAADTTYQGYTTVTLTFADTLVYDKNSQQNVMSGFKRQWVYVSETLYSDSSQISDWENVSTANNRAINLPVGESYVYWKAEDNVGNRDFGMFGPYTVVPYKTEVKLTAKPDLTDPEFVAIFGRGDVDLKATLSDSKNPYDPGMIEFWMDTMLLGVADIIRGMDGTSPQIYTAYAEFNAKPYRAAIANMPPVDSLMKFRTVFKGDVIHLAAKDSIENYQVLACPDAEIKIALTLGAGVDSKVYDAQGIPTPNVTVDYPAGGANPSEYAITYHGNEYGDESMPYPVAPTSPVNVGDYKATAETTNKNYVVQYDSVDFHITPRTVTVTVTPPATPVQTGDPVSFTATIGNLVDQPAGTVTFYLDGVIVASAVPVSYTSGPTGTADWTWPSAAGGSHDIMAEFVPATISNYASNVHTITGYNVNKIAQAPLYFIYDGGVSPVPDVDASDSYDGQTQIYANAVAAAAADTITFGDPDFTLEAIGGTGSGSITYELLSQSPNGGAACVEFNPYTRVAKIKGAGEFRVRATRAADPDYNATDTMLLVKIARAPGKVEVHVDSVDYLEPVRPVITKNLSGGAIDYHYSGILVDGTLYGTVDASPTEAGDYTLTVTSAQTANHEATTSAPAIFAIRQLPQTIVLNHGADTLLWTTDTIPFTLPVTGGAGTGAWTWSDSHPAVATISASGEITLHSRVIPPASDTITVQKKGDNNYFPSNTLQFVINVDYEPTDMSVDTLAPDFANAGYEWTIQATGLPPYTWEVENLPDGMYYNVNGVNDEYLVVQGTPLDVFDDEVIIKVTNAGGAGKTESFHVPMKVYPAPTASTDHKQYVDPDEDMIVAYPIPMNVQKTGSVTVNGRPGIGYWQSDQALVIPHPRDGYDYNMEYTVVISGLIDADGAIVHYRQKFTFRTGSLPPPPPLSRIVTILPLPEGVMSDPEPEIEHVILSGDNFIFSLTVPNPDEWEPVVVTNRIIGGVTEKLKGKRIDDTNVYEYVVRQVRQEHVEISVTLEAGSDVNNEGAGAETKIWSNDGKLYVETSHEGILSAYTLTGELCLQETVTGGKARFTLPRGVYIARMHGKTYKVMIH
jgi:hypothetical protein